MVVSNTANSGGGLYNNGGTAAIDMSTFQHNSGRQFYSGGAIYSSGGVVTVNDSTIISNTAPNGGGIDSESSSVITVTSSTIVSNTAPDGGGGLYSAVNPIVVLSSIVAGNTTGGNCAGTAGIASLGYNLSSDATCAFTATGDISSTVPLLGALQKNGGSTLTMSPLPGSPVINAGGTVCPAYDQRGFARPVSGACDIGAVEFVAHMTFTYMPIVQR